MHGDKIKHIEFTKMSGAGNDFVIVDNREKVIEDASRFAQVVCDRRNGIGADGILLLEASAHADFAMKYFNADGSYGGMCGNGGRCISRYAQIKKIVDKNSMDFEALDYIYHATVLNEDVELHMKPSRDLRTEQAVEIQNFLLKFHFVNSGSPHCVVFLDENKDLGIDLDRVDVDGLGRLIRNHSYFSPEGTNVNFLQLNKDNSCSMRTYERGVEEETLACGTGAVASAIVGNRIKGIESPVILRVKSGERLQVGFTRSGQNEYTNVTLFGSARVVYRGILDYNFERQAIDNAG